MKTFIEVTFIGFLTYTCANWIGSNQCKNDVPSMNNFNATKFFTNKWYVTHNKNKTGDPICQAFETFTQNNKYVIEYKFVSDEQEIKFRCEAEGEGDAGKLFFICTVNEEPTFRAVYVIMGTDYNDLAVLYRCVKMEYTGYEDDNYLLLRRKPGEEDIPECVKQWISTLSLHECSDVTNSCL
uniref:Salivary lipocalin n=1 Tax=Triatoma brasiliensis TaxID=65344 RepID=Q0MTF1_TRIBS|nr:salivary lipocalin [Triatoma brasiliensis]